MIFFFLRYFLSAYVAQLSIALPYTIFGEWAEKWCFGLCDVKED